MSLGSCSSHQRDSVPKIPAGYLIAPVTSTVSLAYPGDTPEAEQALLVEAAEIQIKDFEFDWGSEISPPVTVVVFRSETIPCGDNPGQYGGCHYDPHGPIHAIMGARFHIPVLYHEFVHHMIRDNSHSDPRWGSMWEPRQTMIANGIWADRSGLVFD